MPVYVGVGFLAGYAKGGVAQLPPGLVASSHIQRGGLT